MKKIYIYARWSDWSGPVEKIVSEGYYGPFPDDEETLRVNDPYADQLEADGADVYSITMTDEEAAKYTINSRAFWLEQLIKLEGDQYA